LVDSLFPIRKLTKVKNKNEYMIFIKNKIG
jgi:hypothetical protein